MIGRMQRIIWCKTTRATNINAIKSCTLFLCFQNQIEWTRNERREKEKGHNKHALKCQQLNNFLRKIWCVLFMKLSTCYRKSFNNIQWHILWVRLWRRLCITEMTLKVKQNTRCFWFLTRNSQMKIERVIKKITSVTNHLVLLSRRHHTST